MITFIARFLNGLLRTRSSSSTLHEVLRDVCFWSVPAIRSRETESASADNRMLSK